MGAGHHGTEPTIGGREVARHEVVVVQVTAIVIAHGADAVSVDEIRTPTIVRSGPDVSIQPRGIEPEWILQVPEFVALIP